MSKVLIRRLATSSSSLSKQLDTAKFVKKASFDRNFPNERRQRAWEKTGEDKETFFKRKYAHVHARQLKDRDLLQEYKTKHDKKQLYREESKHIRRERKYQRAESNRYVQSFHNPLTEFVYGTSAVLAALTSGKRQSYTRLLLQGSNSSDDQLVKLAKQNGILIEQMDKHHMNLLSNYNPHNGVILEARPIILNSIKKLGIVSSENQTEYDVYQEDLGVVEQITLPVIRESEIEDSDGVCNPFGVLIDEVTDPHNLGAIIRSAYYLGADFVVVTAKNCAPLNSVVAKASSGALELMNIYSADNPMKFIQESQSNGWKFVSAGVSKTQDSKNVGMDSLKDLLVAEPCVMILGSEGKGIRKNLVNLSDFYVKLESYRSDINNGKSVVDSLNVSVAAALLMDKFFR
ncbi:Mrm1 protein [Saccharomycopsis crataegensis]|uniref:rRNA methyltransferase 1, mitochondrial n=1 Tax=Saccharomycopsis crataegensis TaxID=43959 RepID=A0AAV5QU42_9ASCO|nr:Mrm1 protein [Saccharomycopsis crataegensis]